MNKYIKKRILTLWIVVLLLPAILTFLKLQIFDYGKYKKLAGNNSLRSIQIKAPRGIIYDRNHVPLVDNMPTYSLRIIPVDIIDKETKDIYGHFNFELLENVIGINKNFIKEKLEKYNKKLEKFSPFTVKKFIDFEKKSMLEEHVLNLPGVIFSEIPARSYLSKAKLSHAIGYLRLVDRERIESLNHQDSLFKYSLGDVYGFSGIEKSYEHLLRGTNGAEYRLVDNRGVDHGKFNEKDGIDVINGPPLITSIDIELQLIVEKLLHERVGSIICMNPSNGEVLAFSSSPNYDLIPFVGPVSNEIWAEWNTNENKPLLNRVISGNYPPGSVFKLVTASVLLNKNLENTIHECKGSYKLSEKVTKKCWNSLGHGKLKLDDAIKNSCNVYFYKAVENIRYNDLVDMALKFNFGSLVGIDIPGEKKGLVPTVDYMNKIYKYRDQNGKLIVNWARGGAKANMSIGQGELLTTPMQIINMVNIIANRGYFFTPHLLKDIESNIKNIDLPNFIWSYLNNAMWRVVNSDGGTGRRAYVQNAVVRGKTGTAQNPHGEDHSWFSGYVVTENLRTISLVVMIENGGRGSGIASDMAKEIFSYFSDKNH